MEDKKLISIPIAKIVRHEDDEDEVMVSIFLYCYLIKN